MNHSTGSGARDTLRRTACHYPRSTATLLLLLNAASIMVGAALTAVLAPDWSGRARSLAAMAGPVVVSVAALVLLCTPRDAGLTRPRDWRQPWLIAIPAALSLVPLLGGILRIEAGLLAMLVVGELLTGVVEELFWRGVVLRVLLPTGPLAAALLGSVLFGAAHLPNVFFRDSGMLVLAQAFGAACFGVGYAAIRLRTNTIWPLMACHAATDLFAAIGGLPAIPILVGQDVVLLAVGLVLLTRDRAGTRLTGGVSRPPSAPQPWAARRLRPPCAEPR